MKPYQQLTHSGKLRRLHQLAEQGLTHYDLHQPQIRFHAFATNLLYRVQTGNGERYMLRLAYPGWRSYEDLLSEALWLKALSEETDIPVPDVLPACSGERVLAIDFPGIPDRWTITLMRWVPGRLLGHYLTERNLVKMWALFAALHAHSAAWVPPAGFTQRRFEHWLSRGEENRITGQDWCEILSIEQKLMLQRMDRLVEAAYAALDRADLQVIHCDLWHDNIKLHRGVLAPLDFEDTVWGFRAHDIAMAMLDLLETVGVVRYRELLAAFRQGYDARMAWPDDPIEPFQMGRLLWKINWVARFQSDHLEKMVQGYVPVFEYFMRTGQVILPKED